MGMLVLVDESEALPGRDTPLEISGKHITPMFAPMSTSVRSSSGKFTILAAALNYSRSN